MKPFRIPARRIARRLARKLAKPAALLIIDCQLRSSRARAPGFIVAGGVTLELARHERQRQVELIARRSLVRGW